MGSWADKFEHPTKKALLSELPKDQASLLEKAYRALAETSGSKPKLTWMDLPWNWCFVFSPENKGLLERIYLVPDPESPRIAATIRKSFFEQSPLDTLPKPLHAGIVNGVLINHQTWCQWELTSQEVLNAITATLDLAYNS